MVFETQSFLCRVPVHINSGTEVAPATGSVELHQFFSDFALKNGSKRDITARSGSQAMCMGNFSLIEAGQSPAKAGAASRFN
jgi:hypothetical protein